jgi:high-affinity nickel-transport protein
LAGVLGTVLLVNVIGWSLYLYYGGRLTEATAFLGAGPVAYALGVRHAFDADHIAAIDDTTRLMLQRGRRPTGVGLFFALGHSSVVLVLAMAVAMSANLLSGSGAATLQDVGGAVSATVATAFLLLVGALNAMLLRNLWSVRRRLRRGELAEHEVEDLLGAGGVMSRLLGGRRRLLVRSSWHMFPVGVLFGLGLETASEVSLLALSATAATSHDLPMLALLCLPLLFAAGMSAFDTFDGLLMSRLYATSGRSPVRRLSFNTVMTALTVAVSLSVGAVYLSRILVADFGLTALRGFAAIGEQFELVGYGVVGIYVMTWISTIAWWRLSDRRSAEPALSQGAVAQLAEATRTP